VKNTIHIGVGIAIMLAAGTLYHNPPKILNHEMWELTAFGLHGLGAAPVLRIVADLIGFEI
jgi:hypothetical protein